MHDITAVCDRTGPGQDVLVNPGRRTEGFHISIVFIRWVTGILFLWSPTKWECEKYCIETRKACYTQTVIPGSRIYQRLIFLSDGKDHFTARFGPCDCCGWTTTRWLHVSAAPGAWLEAVSTYECKTLLGESLGLGLMNCSS